MNDHNTIIEISFLKSVGDIFCIEPSIEVFHFFSKFFYIIDDDHRIIRHEGKCEYEIVEIFSLHRVDIDDIEIIFPKCGKDFFRISPNCMDIFYFTVFKMFHGFDMSIPGVFDRCDRSIYIEN